MTDKEFDEAHGHMAEEMSRPIPSSVFNRSLWRADFERNLAALKLSCEQWQYARPCGCKDEAYYDQCETCEAVAWLGYAIYFSQGIME